MQRWDLWMKTRPEKDKDKFSKIEDGYIVGSDVLTV